ncbi:MAG: antibiotic biosynthesis monooxygenase [Streptosporangiales bacterium]|nr:antibiotic biosynthesis monooxygenase [Streptosporangiales bacterium]
MTSTIDPAVDVATLINVFEVDPDRQQELVDVLATATDEVMRHVPGFVSANIHASVDGERVVNYAQWESADAFRAMLADPTAREHMGAATAIARAEPRLYTVASVHHA